MARATAGAAMIPPGHPVTVTVVVGAVFVALVGTAYAIARRDDDLDAEE